MHVGKMSSDFPLHTYGANFCTADEFFCMEAIGYVKFGLVGKFLGMVAGAAASLAVLSMAANPMMAPAAIFLGPGAIAAGMAFSTLGPAVLPDTFGMKLRIGVDGFTLDTFATMFGAVRRLRCDCNPNVHDVVPHTCSVRCRNGN